MTTGAGRLVGELMLTDPSTVPTTTTVGEAFRALRDPHVHLLLLVDGGRLVGTLGRDDLAHSPAPGSPALDLSVLAGRTVGPDAPAGQTMEEMRDAGSRRLAVVDEQGRLLGLLCLKHHGRGFCSPDDVAARR